MDQSFEDKRRLTAERLGITSEQIPRHIAIIMDGNGRWAQEKGKPRVWGHRQGGKTVEEIAVHCVGLGIEVLTLYSFSVENWKRPQEEIDTLMHIYNRYLVAIRPTLRDNNVKLLHLGRLEPMPAKVIKELNKTMELTAGNTGMKLALALNYGGRNEITSAVQKIAMEYKNGKLSLDDINQACISNHLDTAGLPDPDLLIRTANELRVSNFLLWQISYCEFYVTDVYWPDFRKKEIEKAIVAYAKRTRRFGKTDAQLNSE
ncbi:MAG: isoprenyl transferase [Sedimentisphaerales bacterium]|nr:isoprenyl transferase [Sedimentisphaerales bacterium]